ncbi:cytochrome c biogenesis protein DipZ [Bosea robiniae]|uniref:Cytochrome c biogenesis protein CcdA n=1 Tax=Bosea robiniae TaxID=1036780 RepID=A0ABY0P445_9HYPH|nr:cytochrome c biogenesis protein DipZ [Bosea robiniae]SDH21397.1 Cytochrome c biogenesis protein CcdA [Bosea robiniae]
MTLFVASYLAGVLTILSPCILPILPFVLSRAGQSFSRSALPMLVAMAMTFAAVASIAAIGGSWVVQANEAGRYAALALLAIFGVTLISPRAAIFLNRPLVVLGERLSVESAGRTRSIGGSLLLGVATGLLWAPCAGPILGLVLTGAALHGANTGTVLLLVAYAAGAATSLALALRAGGEALTVMKRGLGAGERLRRGVGGAVLASVLAIGFGLDTGLLTRLSFAATAGVEQGLLDRLGRDGTASLRIAENGGTAMPAQPYRSRLPDFGAAPGFEGAVNWLNGAPLEAKELRGKVVLVNFWTYSCINCIRTLPYVRAWAEKYRDQGLVVVGVHTPEFAFEKKVENIRQAAARFGIDYPIAVDNDFRIWRAFRNSYWPAIYLVDAQGRVRHSQFGEGGEALSERALQDLLAEAAGSRKAAAGLATPQASGAQAAPDLANVRSGEAYLGYSKASGFASPEGITGDRPQDYSTGKLRLNQWGLSGNWTIGAESARLSRAGGGIAFRFSARDLHLVLGPGPDGRPIRFQVSVDGAPPAADHGVDIDASGNGTVSETRLYQLVRQFGTVREHVFEIRFLDAGTEAYAFTFG